MQFKTQYQVRDGLQTLTQRILHLCRSKQGLECEFTKKSSEMGEGGG